MAALRSQITPTGAELPVDTALNLIRQRYFGAEQLADLDDDQIEEGLAKLLFDHVGSGYQDLAISTVMQEALEQPTRHKRSAESLARTRASTREFRNPLAYGATLEAAMAWGDTMAARLLLATFDTEAISPVSRSPARDPRTRSSRPRSAHTKPALHDD